MATKDKIPEKNDEISEVNISIPGIKHILVNKENLEFRKKDGLNIIISGPAGSGKTLFALQFAYSAWRSEKDKKNIIYLTKDMTPEALQYRIETVFACFGKETENQGKKSKNGEAQSPQKTVVLLKKYEEAPLTLQFNDFFGIADLDLSFIPPLVFRGDIWQRPLLHTLKELCPRLENVFNEIQNYYKDHEDELIIVIDALSNNLLLECLQKQAERPYESREISSRSVNVFVSEFNELPDEHFASYPPDLHFQFNTRDEGGYSTKTIQIKKSRMQNVRHEAFPYMIVDAETITSLKKKNFTAKPQAYFHCFWKLNKVWHQCKVPFFIGQKLNELIQWKEKTIWKPREILRNELEKKKELPDGSQKNQSDELNENDQVFFDLIDDTIKKNLDETGQVNLDQIGDQKDIRPFKCEDSHLEQFRKPGITIFPSLARVSLLQSLNEPDANPNEQKFIDYHPVGLRFGIPDIDRLTYERMFDSECCTLLITENRCYSGLLGLHYLIGDIGDILSKVDSSKKDNGNQNEKEKIKENGANHTNTMDASQAFGATISNQGAEVNLPCLWQTTPRSVLYISINEDLNQIFHDIYGFSTLHAALRYNFLTQKEFLNQTRESKLEINQSGIKIGDLYSIPLRHASCSFSPIRGSASYLYILIPTLSWTTPEEILELLKNLLEPQRKHDKCPFQNPQEHDPHQRPPCLDYCSHQGNCELNPGGDCIDFFPGNCLTIDRVLLNRVGRISAFWPLIKDKTLFVSNLAQICQNCKADLMIIDDTAIQSSTSDHLDSEWSTHARNIIRLKRVQFHGNETVLFEIVQTGSQNLISNSPHELRIDSVDTIGSAKKLVLRDSFRGYTQLFSGSPQRCKVIVNLMYDKLDTPLYQEVWTMRGNLESLMGDRITVVLSGQDQLIGANSALANLSYVTQDTCHIVAIDEIWLHRIIGGVHQPAGLIHLSARDLIFANPQLRFLINPYSEVNHQNDSPRRNLLHSAGFNYIGNNQKQDNIIAKLIYDRYVTEAFSLAMKKANQDLNIYALPYRHNWGVFTVARPYTARLQRLINAFMKYSQTIVRDDEKWAWQIIGSLLDKDSADYNHIKLNHQHADNIRSISEQIHMAIWKADDGGIVGFCWDDLIFFKRQVWNIVVPTIQKLIADLSMAKNSNDNPDNTAFLLINNHFNDIEDLYFFEFDRSSNESIVCFFLELLLTHEPIKNIFAEDPRNKNRDKIFNTASLLRFQVDLEKKEQLDELKKAFARTLLRMHQLLSPRQRYEIYMSISPMQKRGNQDHSTENPPVSYSLFSREWLSTVPRITHPFDIREEIKILHLPPNKGGNHTMLEEVIKYGADEERVYLGDAKNIGVSVSGMWYLGALSGGNEELAADVIREILSDYHERERLNTKCAAPVQYSFYEFEEDEKSQPENSNSSLLRSIPYSSIVAKVYKTKREDYINDLKNIRNAYLQKKPGEVRNNEVISDKTQAESPKEQKDKNRPTFPFTRSRITQYTNTSLLLIKMIREAMWLNSEKMEELYEPLSIIDKKSNVEKVKGSQNEEDKYKLLFKVIDPVIVAIKKIYDDHDNPDRLPNSIMMKPRILPPNS